MNNPINSLHERWATIKGYEDYYMVSSFGNVKSLQFRPGGKTVYRDKILEGCVNSSGYVIVILVKQLHKKVFMVHRLVAQAFLPKNGDQCIVNHKDGDKTNNNISDLEWCTVAENERHASMLGLKARGDRNAASKLTAMEVGIIKDLMRQGWTVSRIARHFNVTAGAIHHIKSGRNWTWVG